MFKEISGGSRASHASAVSVPSVPFQARSVRAGSRGLQLCGRSGVRGQPERRAVLRSDLFVTL